MINVILRGGLGNNLFQYAVGKHLAVKNNTTLRLNIKNYINRHEPPDFFLVHIVITGWPVNPKTSYD